MTDIPGTEIRELHLMDDDHLRIRLTSVSVDEIVDGGGRALLEIYSTRYEHETAALTITVEAPQFRAAAAGGIPRPDVVPIVAEATARLRKDLLAMIEVVDGMAEEVRRSGLPPLVPSDVK